MDAELKLAGNGAIAAPARARGAGPGPLRETPIETAAREFEAFMIKLLLSQMRKGIGSGGLFEDHSDDGYRDLVEDALAKRAAEAGSFGLARQIVRAEGSGR